MALDVSNADVADTALYADDEEPVTGDPELEVEDEEEPEVDSLDDLDAAVRERVDAYMAREREAQRARFQEAGLDLTADGRPLMADPSRVSQWVPFAAAQAPPPEPRYEAPPPQPAAATPDEPDFDPLAADAAAYERFTQRVAERAVQSATGPLLQEIERLRGMQQRRVESEVTANVREIVRRHIPEIEGALDHPDFDATYRRAIATCTPEQLEDPAQVASIAGWVRTKLDPARMPARRENPAAASLAMNRANREALAQQAPSRSGTGAATDTGRNADDEWGVRFLSRMRENMSDSAARRVEVSSAAWRELGEHDNLDDYKRAKAERLAREGRTGQRRGR